MHTEAPPTKGLAIPYDLYCQECGYNLRGLRSNRCPECGHDLDSMLSQESRIPWVHRDKLGRFRSYWKTVFWASFRYKRFCEEVARPVDYGEAQRFRWVTIAHVVVCVLGILGLLLKRSWPSVTGDPAIDAAFQTGWPVVVIAASITLLLAIMTGLPSYFFDVSSAPPQHRNSAVAMSYYCVSPLAWAFVPFTLAVAAAVTPSRYDMMSLVLMIIAGGIPLALPFLWWAELIHVFRRVYPQSVSRAWAMALLVPSMWGLAAMLFFAVIPLVTFYGYLLLVAAQ